AVPGSMPSAATSVYEEGLMVPPIKLWDQGVPNESALKIMTRNSRMPDSLAADLDAECSACLAGARRLGELFDRYGVEAVEACFDAILSNSTEVYRREILSQIPDGTYVWEDYAEHDGVEEPQLHRQRITLIMDSTKDVPLVIDFTGTGPQAKGPINHCGDYADGNFLKKWLAPILRNLAETPERMAQLDVNEGVVPLIEMRFPEKGTLLTPIFPAPTNARTFVILRLLGVLAGVLAKATDGRMPADQETIRYTGVYGTDVDGEPYLMREVLGGGSGGRYYADGEDTIHVVPDSRNLPTEFTEGRFPLRVERLGLALDSGGAGRYRGGCGYEKHIRVLRDAHFMSIADRSILACWGVKGGKAGRPFQVTVDPGGPNEHDVDALADAEPLKAGTVVRIRTTGGGGWGDPLDRPVDEVLRDLAWRKVSITGARDDYGVVVTDDGTADAEATEALRASMRAARTGDEPFFDRGPGYATLSGGATFNEFDVL
ncbi:MAG: hydantoinase B/oxoprolinase family protein, partial [Blastococcus sp.]